MSQRNNLLDFIKGAAIVSVLFIYALSDDTKEAISYWYHIGQAVPLFLMVTSYLAYKKPVRLFSEQYKNKIIKVLKHIFIPFVMVTVAQIVAKSILGAFEPDRLIRQMGLGPGSYYPWLFIQATIILPIIAAWTEKQHSFYFAYAKVALFCLLINVGITYIDMDKDLFRLLIIRYIPHLFLGCWWAKKGFHLNFQLLCFIALATNVGLECPEPFVFNSWRTFSYITAPYVILAVVFLSRIYTSMKKTIFVRAFTVLGKHSYFVFLTQLFVFNVLKRRHIEALFPRLDTEFMFIVISVSLSLLPLVCYLAVERHRKKASSGSTSSSIAERLSAGITSALEHIKSLVLAHMRRKTF